MEKSDKIFIAGANGMVGSALARKFASEGYTNLLLPSHSTLDLTRQEETERFFAQERPDVAVIAAAKVGGIYANDTYPADFISINMQIAVNSIVSAYKSGVKRLLYLGSTCIYPKYASQPIKESELLTGALEKTNEAYAIAKISGLKLCEYYRKQYGVLYHSAMPTNLYGPNDNYESMNSHVMPALIRKFHEAKINNEPEVILWGTGNPLREFLHVDDLASACLCLLKIDNPPNIVNLGSGEEVSIKQLASIIADVVGYKGKIKHDLSKPDGTPRKLCDTTLLRSTGWTPEYTIRSGIEAAYKSFLSEIASRKIRI